MDGVLAFLSAAVPGAPVAVSAANPLPVTFGAGVGNAVWGPDASGAAPTHPAVFVAGIDGGGFVRPLKTGAGGEVFVTGSTGAGVADGGNPVKVGGVYNLVLPTLASGQRGDMQLTNAGSVHATLYGNGAGAILNGGAGDGIATTTSSMLFTATQGLVFNGVTSDMARGSAADGTINKPYALRANDLKIAIQFAAIGSSVVFAAAGAGIQNFITAIQVSNGVGAGESLVIIKDGATVIYQEAVAPGAALNITFPTPLAGTVNTAMNVQISTAAGGTVINFNAQGYKG